MMVIVFLFFWVLAALVGGKEDEVRVVVSLVALGSLKRVSTLSDGVIAVVMSFSADSRCLDDPMLLVSHFQTY